MDAVTGGAQRCFVGDAQLHATNVGLMRDRVRHDLERNRVAERCRMRSGLVDGGGESGFGHVDAGVGKQLFRFHLGQQRALFGAGLGDQIDGHRGAPALDGAVRRQSTRRSRRFPVGE